MQKKIPGLRIQINVPTYLSKLEKNKEMPCKDILMFIKIEALRFYI